MGIAGVGAYNGVSTYYSNLVQSGDVWDWLRKKTSLWAIRYI